jgi:hypothetical protein
MPLAVFVGVNNHLQSTILGVALMGDESTDSFEWVFSTFLKCMGGKQPICILTGMYTKTNLEVQLLKNVVGEYPDAHGVEKQTLEN